MEEERKCEQIEPSSRKELEIIFESDDENAIGKAMYSAAQHEPDWCWTQTKLAGFPGHESPLIRSTAVNALGELVLFRGHVDLEVVMPGRHKLENDPVLAAFCEGILAGPQEPGDNPLALRDGYFTATSVISMSGY